RPEARGVGRDCRPPPISHQVRGPRSPESGASPRYASDDPRRDEMGDAQRFRKDPADGRERERLLDLAPARTDVGHPDRSMARPDRLELVPPNDCEPFVPVVETAPQRGLD